MTHPTMAKTQRQEEASLSTLITQTSGTRRAAQSGQDGSPARAKQAEEDEPRPNQTHRSGRSPKKMYNRIRVLMVHAPRYSFQGQARLAADADVSRSTISRLLSGHINPSFRLAQAVTAALEKHLKRPLDPRELLSPDGTYPTPSGCQLSGCRGCMPEEAYDNNGCLRSDFCDLRPGDWSLARPLKPRGAQQTPGNAGKEAA